MRGAGESRNNLRGCARHKACFHLSTPSSFTMSKKGVDISFIKPAMDNDDWKREVTDVEKCLVIVEVYSSK